MMWRVWHKLFGWKYVVVEYGWSDYIRRVRTAPNGTKYIKLYGLHQLSYFAGRCWELT